MCGSMGWKDLAKRKKSGHNPESERAWSALVAVQFYTVQARYRLVLENNIVAAERPPVVTWFEMVASWERSPYKWIINSRISTGSAWDTKSKLSRRPIIRTYTQI